MLRTVCISKVKSRKIVCMRRHGERLRWVFIGKSSGFIIDPEEEGSKFLRKFGKLIFIISTRCCILKTLQWILTVIWTSCLVCDRYYYQIYVSVHVHTTLRLLIIVLAVFCTCTFFIYFYYIFLNVKSNPGPFQYGTIAVTTRLWLKNVVYLPDYVNKKRKQNPVTIMAFTVL